MHNHHWREKFIIILMALLNVLVLSSLLLTARGRINDNNTYFGGHTDQVDGPVDQMDGPVDQVDGPVDQVGVMVGQVVEQHLAGCHLVLADAGKSSPILSNIIRHVSGVYGGAVLEVGSFFSQDRPTHQHLLRGLWGDATTACRSLILDLTNDNIHLTFRFLEESRLWLWPETRVLFMGPMEHVETVFNHHSLRNTIHALYLTLDHFALNAVQARLQPLARLRKPPTRISAGVTEVIGVYRRCLYCKNGESGVQYIYSWRLKIDHHQDALRFPDSSELMQDMMGHTFSIVGLELVPYTNYIRDVRGFQHPVTPQQSLDFSMLNAFANKLNFTYEMRPPYVNQFGLPLGNGNWTGTVGTLQHELADFSLILSQTPGRMEVIDFSRIYNSESLCIVSPKPLPHPQHLQLFKPFSGQLWLILITSIVGWGSTLWLLQTLWSWVTKGSRISFINAILYSWGVILGDVPSKPPPNITGRAMVGWWLVFCLVVTTAYRSSLVAHLTVPSMLPAINSFQDLTRQDDWTWGSVPITGSIYLYFSRSTDPVTLEVFRNLQFHPLDKGMNMVVKGHHSEIANMYTARIMVASRYTDASGYTPVHISRTKYPVFAGVAWGFRKGAPFRKIFTTMKQRMIEAGLIDHWTEKAIEAAIKTRQEEAAEESRNFEYSKKEGNRQVVLNLHHLQSVFYLLLLGYGVSFLAFLRETVAYACRGMSGVET